MAEVSEKARHPEPAVSFVVYDSGTGEILQVHHFSARPGISMPAHDKLREMTLEHAVHVHQRDRATMEAFQVATQEMKPGVDYRVSLKDGKLIEKPRAPDTHFSVS